VLLIYSTLPLTAVYSLYSGVNWVKYVRE